MDELKDSRRINFFICENKILDDTDKFDKNEILAYITLLRFANNNNTCFPSYNKIAKYMRTSRVTAINAISNLKEKGVIKVTERKNKDSKENTSNLFTIIGVEDLSISKNQDIFKSNINKFARTQQSKILDEHRNVKLVKSYKLFKRLGRLQKQQLSEMDNKLLEMTLERMSLYNNGNFNYLLKTYETIKNEQNNSAYNSPQIIDTSDKSKFSIFNNDILPHTTNNRQVLKKYFQFTDEEINSKTDEEVNEILSNFKF